MDENNNVFDWQQVEPLTPEEPPVAEEAPAAEPAPQDIPPPLEFMPYQPPPQAAKKKRSAYKMIIAVCVAISLFFGGALVAMLGLRFMHNTSESGSMISPPAVTGDSRMELAATPDSDRSVARIEGGMTSVEIHEKLRNANVAVQIYGGRSNALVGEGSGVIIHEDSTGTYTYVVTCAHVISDMSRDQSVSIELENGDSFDAVVVGFDSRTDVGLLRIRASGLQGATFGDSTTLQVGEPVYAIGNPGGISFKGSFTSGIVSAIDRPITSRHTMITIQHTAPISPGNSGGALVNALGQVIGINSQKIVSLQYEGMGFAIPSAVVQEVVNNLIAMGYVPNRPKLGIQYIAATRPQAGSFVVRANNLPSGSLIIARIDDDSSFAGTEVRPNDIITHVNGEPMNKPDVLLQIIESGSVGLELTLTIARVNHSNLTVENSFDVTVQLVEDKGSSAPAEETRPWYEDEVDPFGNPFGNWPW